MWFISQFFDKMNTFKKALAYVAVATTAVASFGSAAFAAVPYTHEMDSVLSATGTTVADTIVNKAVAGATDL